MIVKTKQKTYFCKHILFVKNKIMLIPNDNKAAKNENGDTYFYTEDLEEFCVDDNLPVINLKNIVCIVEENRNKSVEIIN